MVFGGCSVDKSWYKQQYSFIADIINGQLDSKMDVTIHTHTRSRYVMSPPFITRTQEGNLERNPTSPLLLSKLQDAMYSVSVIKHTPSKSDDEVTNICKHISCKS